MNHPSRTMLLAISVSAALTSTLACAEVTQGAILSSTCYACHGTDGHSSGAIPSIYGIPAESLTAKLQAFKQDQTLATVMNRHAKGYTDAEILLIAEHLSRLK